MKLILLCNILMTFLSVQMIQSYHLGMKSFKVSQRILSPSSYSVFTSPMTSNNKGGRSNLIMKAAIPLPSLETSRVTSLFSIPNITQPITQFFTILATLLSAFILRKSNAIQIKLKSAAESMESGWRKRGLGGGFFRTIEVWTFAISYLFKYLRVERLKNGDKEVYSKAKTEIAELLRDKLLELGPTFIKLGQLLSTRIDVFSKEFISALVLLQDQVPGFNGDVSVKIIEEEFGKPIHELFDSFDRNPLAAASLGQVHRAVLNGKEVAVKIQRQGLKDLFDMDLKNIKVLAQILDKLDPKTDGAQRDWGSIYDESAKLLYKEIDYENEAVNAMRFQENFRDIPWIKVPDVYLERTTRNVLTMEYVPGIKINDIEKIEQAGIDRKLLARRSAESYLSQLCRHGFFHCDPHPGNLVCDNVDGGRLIYYDFGMMDELNPEVKRGLVNLIFSIYETDVKGSCDALEEIGILRPNVDRTSIEKIARVFLKDFAKGVETGKWTNQLSKEEQKEIRRQRRLQLAADLFTVGNDVPFKFPPTFTFVFRAFTTLDGIGKGLDPTYDLTRLAQPYLKELIDLRDGSASITLLKTWGKKLGWRPEDIAATVQSPRKVANIENLLTKMEQGDLKLRVRVLESERSFKRMELVQNNMALGVAASGFMNMGLILATVGSPQGQISIAAKAMLALAALFGIQVPIGMMRLKALDKKFASFQS